MPSKSFLAIIIISVVAAALALTTGLFAFFYTAAKSEIAQLNQQVASLQKQIDRLSEGYQECTQYVQTSQCEDIPTRYEVYIPIPDTEGPDIRHIDLHKVFSVTDPFLLQTLNIRPDDTIGQIQYLDVDKDGSEEVAFTNDIGGTGGPGPLRVFRKIGTPGGDALQEIEIDRSFTQDVHEGARGHYSIGIHDGQFFEAFPIYLPDEPNCCPTGGWRTIVFKWEKEHGKLIVEKVIDGKKRPWN